MDARGFARWLTAAAVGYAVMHHVGALPGGLGEVGVTRWADWIDVATPFLVLLPAAAALAAAAVGARRWAAFAVGAIGYAEGKGMHVAANSIGNVEPSDAVHLWDEVVGHLVWYGGTAIVLGVLATAMREAPRPTSARVLVAGSALGLAVGGTWFTNALGGGSIPFHLAVAVALTGYGARHRDSLAAFLPISFAPAAVALAVASVS